MPDIFLSYSREDQPTARRFAEAFEREGFSVWWDQVLNPGETFDKVTERALEQSKAVVVLWSKTSVNSNWVRAEAMQAFERGILVPAMIEPCKRPSMFDDQELTLAALRRGLIVYKGFIADINVWLPYGTDFRTDPRFKALLRDLGLIDYFRASGNWGDFCKPVRDDFECR